MVDRRQPMHHSYRQYVLKVQDDLVTTWACFTEVMYLSLERGGWAMQKQIVQYVLDDLLLICEITLSDFDRLFALMEKYQDRPMDLADATLVLAAEKTGINNILTLDSDFLFYRINDQDSFSIIEV